MNGITSVSFGPNGTWIVCKDSDITWSCDLPTPVFNKLNGRRGNKRCAPTNVAAMGPSNTYALFFNDHNWWVNHDSLADDLNDNNINGYDVKTVSFGDDGSYLLLLKGGGCYWCNVHRRLEQLIQTKNNASIQWATIGTGNSYYILYDDGVFYWGGDIPDDLDETLKNNETNCNEKVWLSAFDDSYFIERSNGTTEWSANESFSNNQYCDKWMNPRKILYTNGSISQEFTCGRSIHDTADSLRNGELNADDIPLMHVFKWNGNTFSLNNRRLWALSVAEVDSAPVKYVTPPGVVASKLSNGFRGTSVRLR